MKIARTTARVALALIGLLAAAMIVGDIHLVAVRRLAPSPDLACTLLWDIWVVSWAVSAMVWSRPAAARPPAIEEVAYWLAPAIGIGLLALGSIATHFPPLWVTPAALGWVLAGACAAGLLFTWWARIALGSLWSGSVSRKRGHTVVQSGPYRLVRHPIYTGLIAAALAHAVVIGQGANLAGALLLAFGFWLKAQFEERFLCAELGEAAYADYRRATPMLAPFWPTRR